MQETEETRVPSLDWGGSPGGGNGNSLQYSCLENPVDRGAWQATVHRAASILDYLLKGRERNFSLIYLIAILGYPQLNLIPTNTFKNTQLLVNHKLLQ